MPRNTQLNLCHVPSSSWSSIWGSLISLWELQRLHSHPQYHQHPHTPRSALEKPVDEMLNKELKMELKQQRRRRATATVTKSRCFKLNRAYSISFNSSSVGNLFRRWILTDCIDVQEKKEKVVVLRSRLPQNVKLGSFTLWLCNDGQEMYKKAWKKCKVVILLIQTYCFFMFSSQSSSLSSLSSLTWCREPALQAEKGHIGQL